MWVGLKLVRLACFGLTLKALGGQGIEGSCQRNFSNGFMAFDVRRLQTAGHRIWDGFSSFDHGNSMAHGQGRWGSCSYSAQSDALYWIYHLAFWANSKSQFGCDPSNLNTLNANPPKIAGCSAKPNNRSSKRILYRFFFVLIF